MSPDFKLAVHEVLCIVLWWTVFARAVRSCDRVRTDVRAAFFALGIVACGGVVAPLAWAFVPDCFELSLLAAVTAVELVTTIYWANGVPTQFYKPGMAPPARVPNQKQ